MEYKQSCGLSTDSKAVYVSPDLHHRPHCVFETIPGLPPCQRSASAYEKQLRRESTSCRRLAHLLIYGVSQAQHCKP